MNAPVVVDLEPTLEQQLQAERDKNRELQRALADETEKARIRGIKVRRGQRTEATISQDPETDELFAKARERTSYCGATGLVAATLAHGGTKNTLTYVDPGPHPRGRKDDPGWGNAPEVNVERTIERTVEKHPGVVVTEAFVRAVAAEVAESMDRRMNTVHARVHRAVNSIAWALLVAEHGLEHAREMKARINWWLLRDGAEPAEVEP